MENFVSVVVLTAEKDLPEHIYKDLSEQTYRRFEVIVANEKGIVPAMNKALARAKGDIFVRIDDDVRLPKNWLRCLVSSFYFPLVGGATGPTIVPVECRKNRDSIAYTGNPNFFLRWLFDNDPYAVSKIYKSGSVSYGSNFREHIAQAWMPFDIDHLEGTNWAMRTELIREVGGFDPAFDGVAEWYDTDVEAKIKKLGFRLTYNTDAWLEHHVSKGKNFEKRYNGLGRIKNWMRYHWRHSKFHPKMIIWLILMVGYTCLKKYQQLFQR